MTISKLHKFAQSCLNGRIPFSVRAKQLKELYTNMCRHPKKWNLPHTFGKESNTDWNSVWSAFNWARFNGCPYDPRNVPVEWKQLPTEWLIRIFRDSVKPKQIAEECFCPVGFLNNKEAHQWLSWVGKRLMAHTDGTNRRTFVNEVVVGMSIRVTAFCPAVMLLGEVPWNLGRLHLLNRTKFNWVAAKYKLEGFTRSAHVWNDTAQRYTSITIAGSLNEVLEADLVQGANTSPEKVMELLIRRKSAKHFAYILSHTAPYPDWPTGELYAPLLPGMRHINSSKMLVEEAISLGHCVGTYHTRIKDGSCLVVSVTGADGSRSTLELTRLQRVNQHQGYGNSDPPEGCRAILKAWQKTKEELEREYARKQAEAERIAREQRLAEAPHRGDVRYDYLRYCAIGYR